MCSHKSCKPRKGKRARRSRESPIPESRAISPAITLVSRRPHGIFLLLVCQEGSEEFFQRHNSARELPPSERISATSIQEGATGLWYFANSFPTTLVKCLESCRREEKRAIGAHAVQLFPTRCPLTRLDTPEKRGEL